MPTWSVRQPCSLAVPSMPPELTSRRLSLLACFHVQVWKRARPELIHVQWPMRCWAVRQCRGLDNAYVLRPMRSRLHLPCWIDQAHCCAMPRCGGLVAVWSSRGGRFIILVVSVFCCRGSCFCCSGGAYGDGISCSGECEVRCRCGIATSCADSPSLPHRCASTGRLLLPTRIVFTSCSAVRWHRLLLPCRVVCTAAGGCWSLHAAFHRCFHHAHRPSPVPRRLLLCGRWPSAHVPCWYLRRGGRCPVVGVFRPVPAWSLRQWLLQPRGV